jgi:FkbM family methyltransferase
MKERQVTALVPMKGQSERVPGKNVRIFCGSPLLCIILQTLQNTECIEKVVVNTDDALIAERASAFSKVSIHKRPDELRGHHVSMNAIIGHDLGLLGEGHYLQTHATNPLLLSSTVADAVKAYFDGLDAYDSLFSVTRRQVRLYDSAGAPLNHDPEVLLNTQDLPPFFEENSCLYLFSRQSFRLAGRRIGRRPKLFTIPHLDAHDIDTEEDFTLSEALHRAFREGSGGDISKRRAAILGNGPSLRGFDFARELAGYDTFGMNAAYRHWDAVGWYPTWYCCLDTVLGLSHKDAIRRLIENAARYGIRGFLLRDNLVQALGEAGTRPYVHNMDKLRKTERFFIPDVTTGSHSLAWAASLGYKDILLLGVDADYVEIIDEARRLDGFKLEIAETPERNPNYFFDGYQQKGDKYHIPNPHKETAEVHLASWRRLAPLLALAGVAVVNANPASRLDCFPKASFKDAPRRLSAIRRDMDAERESRAQAARAPGLTGVHSRAEHISLDELKLFYALRSKENGMMLDVGAHAGGSCLSFLKRGRQVHAFEPDPAMRAWLVARISAHPGAVIDARAVSDVSGQTVPWYISPESSGINSMLPFAGTHVKNGSVTTVALRDYCAERHITHIDLLKIDAQGYDLRVLQGFPFETLRPEHIICKFEDSKTCYLGSTLHDQGRLLLENGYHVYMSEWYPAIRYGIRHDWRRLAPYPAEPSDPFAWGNLLAFAEKPDEKMLIAAVRRQHLAKRPPDSPELDRKAVVAALLRARMQASVCGGGG